MILIRADGAINRITTGEPLSEAMMASGEPGAAVLEIAGGRAAQLDIKAGDTVK